MNGKVETTTKPVWKNPFVYTGVLIVVLAIYIGWVVFSRWNENRVLEQRARDLAAEKQREQDKNTIEQMGGSELAIQSFYGNPTIRRGQTGQLCYGVANAKKVTLEPQSSPVWPSYSRCVDITPAKTTTYTLTASDASGHTVSQTFTVKVQ
ncbi:MAG: hypothetical protein JSS69_09170 [Acidobacteria bacterium]|nr:hypothetical protein [Acidobacteriota bacterium]MBS1866076.1 hypothetical protein [Acidobacteriota bacterium]